MNLDRALAVIAEQHHAVLATLRKDGSGEHPDWDDYRAAIQRDQRVLRRIELVSAGSDRDG